MLKIKSHNFTLKYLPLFYFHLVILKIQDENVLKTINGGELLAANYFSRIREIGLVALN